MTGSVLLVEDEENLASLVQAYLEREGYSVVSVGSGSEALPEASSLPRRREHVCDPPGAVAFEQAGCLIECELRQVAHAGRRACVMRSVLITVLPAIAHAV